MSNPREARTKRLRARFLAALTDHGIVARAAREAGVGRRTLYDWRGAEPEFADEWDRALTLGLAALEDEAMRRAWEGSERTVWYQGKAVGTERRQSDAMLMFVLRNRLPDRWGVPVGGRSATRAGARGNHALVELPCDNVLSDGTDLNTLTYDELKQRYHESLAESGFRLVPLEGFEDDPFNRSFRMSPPSENDGTAEKDTTVAENGP